MDGTHVALWLLASLTEHHTTRTSACARSGNNNASGHGDKNGGVVIANTDSGIPFTGKCPNVRLGQ